MIQNGVVTALQSSSVRIETTQVSIKVIQVGRKQMTVSVFKQLPEKWIAYTDGVWDRPITPWGWVKDTEKPRVGQALASLPRG